MYNIKQCEWEMLDRQFCKFISWIAKKTCLSLRSYGVREEMSDIVSELNCVLVDIAAKYKKQVYLDSCNIWIEKNSSYITPYKSHDVLFHFWKWRFRKLLRSKSGTISKDDDKIIVDFMASIQSAPVDFRWEKTSLCLDCVNFVKHSMNDEDIKIVYEYIQSKTRDIETGDSINKMMKKYFSCDMKPCYDRPFFLDTIFHTYVKNILVNFGKTYIRNYVKKNYIWINCEETNEGEGYKKEY